ncbi:thioester-containing protein 1 allele R1-like [Uranotaenia lowii]|uniref:thioester-containing protein 1 allele R1-like n=1 Tax=Uranotaenia lowii TaxID=190385 RepID=UPI00247B1A9D|nr:thioester-containing protein 1 allele R1-like [Uranotaenia lowii]
MRLSAAAICSVFYWFVFFLIRPGESYQKSTYIILAPSSVKVDQPLRIAFCNVDSTELRQFNLAITGPEKQEDKSIMIAANSQEIMSFKLNGRHNEKYNIRITDASNTEISHDFDVSIDAKTHIVLVQTDKPIYKPGDTVKFRVLVLDRQTRPVEMGKNVTIRLRNAKRNLIQEWLEVDVSNGVYQSQLELANFIPLGHWSIEVEKEGEEKTTKSFEVAEYVLPLHKIKMYVNKHATWNDKSITLIVEAHYTFGKPIVGQLSIEANDETIRENIDIEGRLTVDIDLSSLNLDENFSEDILWQDITAKIVESGSDHLYETTQSIPISKRAHKLSVKKSAHFIHTDTRYTFWITLTDPFGKPFEKPGLIKTKLRRGIKMWFSRNDSWETFPDSYGMLEVFVDITKGTTRLDLEVEYGNEILHFGAARLEDSVEQEPYIKLALQTMKPKLHQKIHVLIESNIMIDFLMYHVVARGEILLSEIVSGQHQERVMLTIPTSFKMVPEAHLIVFATHKGNLLQKSISINIDDLDNFVEVSLSEQTVQPGQNLTVTASTKPGSYIGMLAIDESVLLLGTDNDINRTNLYRALDSNYLKNDRKKTVKDMGFSLFTSAEIPLRAIMLLGVDVRFAEDEPEIRKNFAETWLWNDMAKVGDDGKLVLKSVVPDTITGWAITAFSISATHGLGITRKPVSLTVIKPFFITVNLAYSIVIGEIAVVEVFVHNYHEKSVIAEIRLVDDLRNFDFVDNLNQTTDKTEESKTISLVSNPVHKVVFHLKPKRSGLHKILLQARTETRRDSVEKFLRVTPGGIRYYRNLARLIEADNSEQNINNIMLVIPGLATSGTENITFSVEGILIGSALTNLGGLIRLPSGCGEQNMLNLVPSVLALNYMKNTDTLDATVEKQALDYLRKGYQNQLNYRLNDGSFSVFGKSDGRGSVFLTALVAKTFRIASQYITVDKKVIRDAFNWLEKQQQTDGKFTEVGKVWHQTIQGSLQEGVTLTAYTVIAFLEHEDNRNQFKTSIDKGTTYLARQLDSLSDPYALSLTTYALQLAQHPRVLDAWNLLLDKSDSDSDSEKRWWKTGSTSIETAGYALLTNLNASMAIDGKPIMQWLVSQRYDKGGYDNIQNTFVGLQALASYAERLSTSRNNYEITIIDKASSYRKSLQVTPKNSVTPQQVVLPQQVRDLDVHIQGTGTGVFQIAYEYNYPTLDDEPRFEIKSTVSKRTGREADLNVHICSSFKPQKLYEITNMVLMEILMPSGYAVNEATISKLKRIKDLKKIEAENDNTRLVLYFNSLPSNQSICLDVSGYRKAIVLGQIAGWIKVYDYYDSTREAMQYFQGTLEKVST